MQAGQTAASPCHTYTAGTYQVRISGTYSRLYFNNNANAAKLDSIDQW